MHLKKNFYVPSLADMLFMAIFLYLCLSRGGDLLGDGDTGYHIRAGEWILENLAIPKLDIFSFHTPQIPWTAHEWLSEVIMALVHQVGGLTGIVVFFTFLLALVYYLLFHMLRRNGCTILISTGIVLLATATSKIHWLARPHIFSLLLFLAWYWILDDFRHGRAKRLLFLPPLMLLWANLHGGFVAGFMLLGIFFLGELPGYFSPDTEQKRAAWQRIRQLVLAGTACLIAACINPYGWHILLFPFDLVSNKLIMDNVSEWMSPNFHEPNPFKYLLLLLVTLWGLSKKRVALTDLLLVLMFLNMSLYSVRYITLFAIIVAPLLARHGDLLFNEASGVLVTALRRRAEAITALDGTTGGIHWPVLAVLTVTVMIGFGAVHHDFNPKIKPVAAVQFLKQVPVQGNMFNNDEFGDYLIYRAWPDYKVFFDGRSDMYGTAMLKEYMKVRSFKDGWEDIFRKYNITWVFFDADSPLARYLRDRKDWVAIYQDKVAVIFVKNLPQYADVIARHRVEKWLPVDRNE